MALAVVGLNHRTSPVEVREKLYFKKTDLTCALDHLRAKDSSIQAVIVSTCNRVEVYTYSVCEATHKEFLVDFLAEFHDVPKEVFADSLYFHTDMDAARHLFEVASGIDSMVVGETQILGQVSEAYDLSLNARATGKELNVLFQKALSAAKKVRSSTSVCEGEVSVSSVAVKFAVQVVGDLATKTVMLLGAGDTSELTLRHLAGRGIGAVVVSNRTWDRAQALADEYGGTAIRFDEFANKLPDADILISSTAAPHAIILPGMVKSAIRRRKSKPMFMLDLAVPRDIHPDIDKIENVYLYDLDDLEEVAAQNTASRRDEVIRASEMVERAARSIMWLIATPGLDETMTDLTERLHGVRRVELERALRKLDGLDPDARAQVEYMTERLVNRILDGPRRAAKRASRNGSGAAVISTIRKMFQLDKE
jgi:glutamyl-tRNA reductase